MTTWTGLSARTLLVTRVVSISVLVAVCCIAVLAGCARPPAPWLSPTAIVVSPDQRTLWIAAGTSEVLLECAPDGAIRRRIVLPAAATGAAISRDGRSVAVTTAGSTPQLCVIDVERGSIRQKTAAGHSATAPVFSRDGKTVFLVNRFADAVRAIDAETGRTRTVVPVRREPIAAALSSDGKRLVVAHHLHDTRGDAEHVAAGVTLLDADTLRVTRTLDLANGAGLALGVAISPDDRWAAVTHNLARFKLPTTQVDRGWMNSAAVSLIDLRDDKPATAVLLDNIASGAANPWGVAWSPDGSRLMVTHAGTHELSVIDAAALLAKLAASPAKAPAASPSEDLGFLLGLRRRVPLASRGPRALAVAGDAAWVAGYFNDVLERLDWRDPKAEPQVRWTANTTPLTLQRRGEIAFNDASLCFQQWQSCASCHSYDARVDGLNWDLLNDGMGNPKNSKSLLWSHRTPPAMSMGVRENAEIAVRAGFRYIQFSDVPADVPATVDAYLRSLEPQPSPALENGRLSAAARRGERIFRNAKTHCATCHAGALLTDLRTYDVGTTGPDDSPTAWFDTPTLVELWRTAPYLHDGSARTLRDVLTTRNRDDRHGTTSHLTAEQLDDLVAYLRSL